MHWGINLICPGIFWIFRIMAFIFGVGNLIPPPFSGMMKRCYKFHSASFYSLAQLTDNISTWTHIHRIPFSQVTIPHGKPIMMLCNRSGKLGPRINKQICPLISIKIISSKKRNQVFVAEISRITISFLVKNIKVSIFLFFIQIHSAGVPLISPFRNRIGTPMCINTKFRIPKPFRIRVLL